MKSRIIEVRGCELEVFENGVIYSVPFTDDVGRFRPRKRRRQSNSNGYRKIGVYGSDKVACPISVHRLVAQAFLPEWREDWHVDHIDMDKSNNNAYNLRMMSPSDHAKSHKGLYGRRLPVGGKGSLEWVDGFDDIFYEKKLDSFAYLFKYGEGMVPTVWQKSIPSAKHHYLMRHVSPRRQ